MTTEIKNMNDNGPRTVKVGMRVRYRGNWGINDPTTATIEEIDLCERPGEKYGEPVDEVPIKDLPRCCVTLSDGHWAYGTQIDEVIDPATVRERIRRELQKFPDANGGLLPDRADAEITWDDGLSETATIAIGPYSCDTPPKDDEAILYYASSVEELLALTIPGNGSDFTLDDIRCFSFAEPRSAEHGTGELSASDPAGTVGTYGGKAAMRIDLDGRPYAVALANEGATGEDDPGTGLWFGDAVSKYGGRKPGAWRLPGRREMRLLIGHRRSFTRMGDRYGLAISASPGRTVFLPAGGVTLPNDVHCSKSWGAYWTGDPAGSGQGVALHFAGSTKICIDECNGLCGLSVRLVSELKGPLRRRHGVNVPAADKNHPIGKGKLTL